MIFIYEVGLFVFFYVWERVKKIKRILNVFLFILCGFMKVVIEFYIEVFY